MAPRGGVRRRGARGRPRRRRDRRPGLRSRRRQALMPAPAAPVMAPRSRHHRLRRGRPVRSREAGVLGRAQRPRHHLRPHHRDHRLGPDAVLRQPEGSPPRRQGRAVRARGGGRVLRARRPPTADPSRFGTIFATGVGGLRSTEEQIEVLIEKGERRVSPFLVPMMMPNAAGAAISMRYGLQGPNETITTACAASTHAIGYAARLIAWGMIDACVTGGSESAACPIGVAVVRQHDGAHQSGNSRPFSPERDGFVLGEGAAVLMLEEWEAAVARGANIVGEVLGAASNADAHHITAPAPGGTGAIKCMQLALHDAGLTPADIKPDQRARHQHAAQRRRRGRGRHRGVRCRRRAGHLHQGRHRPRTRRRRRAGGSGRAAVDGARAHPAHRGTTQLDEGFEIDLVMGAARPWTPGPPCRTASASAATTAASSWPPPADRRSPPLGDLRCHTPIA
jgi:3-oxoacyl-[acyl-carrier-protein] synthase II